MTPRENFQAADPLAPAARRVLAYLRCLPLPETRRLELALDVLRGLESAPPGPDISLEAASMGLLRRGLDVLPLPAPPQACPPLNRGRMVPERMPRRRWVRSLARLLRGRSPVLPPDRPRPWPRYGAGSREYLNEPWGRVAARRRTAMGVLILLPTVAAALTMASVLPHGGTTLLEAAITVVFAVLFAWISVGFWIALCGFAILALGGDRFQVTSLAGKEPVHVRPTTRTAVLFPACNENPASVMAGVAATWRSLEREGRLDGFDFYVLSDTGSARGWVEETAAWRRLVDELGGAGRVFYRRRVANLKRKSGNIADFCRRWGRNYTYMVIMDADSLLSGAALGRMLEVMERKRNVGILQTVPVSAGRSTLLARMQQFVSHASGPMFSAGLHFLQLGDAQYWGHNAMIRVRPFMEHCALDRLTGSPPLGGDVMSHDFVEAALMRRAGWGVWLAFDLRSQEEPPPTLLAELKRDRRWCTGNLQHLRLVFTRGLFPAHRVLFLNGAMSYISSLLWFGFLLLSTTEAVLEAVLEPDYFPFAKMLFPAWPTWRPEGVRLLLGGTAVVLFLPKLLAWLLALGRARRYGGVLGLSASLVAETVGSTLLAPIRMLFHSRAVITVLLGRQVGWNSQQRDDRPTGWLEALRFHWPGTLTGLVWGGVVLAANPWFFVWISPIVVALVLSIPVSVLTSRVGLGRLARRLNLFVTPTELDPTPEMKDRDAMEAVLGRLDGACGGPRLEGLARVVLDPEANRLHRALLRRARRLPPVTAARRRALAERLLAQGPGALSDAEQRDILSDAQALEELHARAWELPGPALASAWGLIL